MTVAYPKPFISLIISNLHKHTARQQPRNQQGAPTGEPYYGEQLPMTVVQTDLWLAQTNIGSQKFAFGEAAMPPVAGIHNGLPASSAIVTNPIHTAISEAITEAIDLQMPEFDGSDDPGAKKLGPKMYHRINRLEAVLPWGKPAEQVVAAMIGVYMDEACTQQVPDVDFVILFCNDEFVVNRAGRNPQGLVPDGQAIMAIRKANNWLSLSELLMNAPVQTAIASLGSNFFTAVKAGVPAYAEIDVSMVMTEFLAALASMVQVPSEPAPSEQE